VSDQASDKPIQIFLSYARYDDRAPPDLPGEKGFVSFLRQQLIFELLQRGEPRPIVWRDIENIGKNEEFTQPLREAINDSHILVVVLSGNWLSRPNCRQELDAFAERWKGSQGVRERIFVVRKREVKAEDHPELLQDREGFKFYDLEDPENIGMEREYFGRGRIQDDRYTELVRELGGHLWRAAARMKNREAAPVPPPPPTWSNGRTAFVAKPATDMRSEYDRVVRELTKRGFTVVPDPRIDIPYRNTAVRFIDDALARAEASIHLLGVAEGYVPEDREPTVNRQLPIVKLQLKRAAARLEGTIEAQAESAEFRRFVWAPETLPTTNGSGRVRAERNPLSVLKKLDCFHDSDEVVGGSLSKFVDLLVESLDRRARRTATVEDEAKSDPLGEDGGSAGGSGRNVYIYHRQDDRDFARQVAQTLSANKLVKGDLRLPPLEGEEAEQRRVHRQELVDCDTVVLCWALATDTWARTSAHELKNWRGLGRSEDFARCCMVVGPPPRAAKVDFIEFQRMNEIDVLVNQMRRDEPSVEELEKLFSPRAP
jgi:hypothetical protein